MTEEIIPVLRVVDADATAAWYARLGFVRDFEHRFAANLPLYLGIRRGQLQLHLSEHDGDAPPRSLVYMWVDDLDPLAREFDKAIRTEPWGREIELVDPDGNRLRLGQRH